MKPRTSGRGGLDQFLFSVDTLGELQLALYCDTTCASLQLLHAASTVEHARVDSVVSLSSFADGTLQVREHTVCGPLQLHQRLDALAKSLETTVRKWDWNRKPGYIQQVRLLEAHACLLRMAQRAPYDKSQLCGFFQSCVTKAKYIDRETTNDELRVKPKQVAPTEAAGGIVNE